MFAVTSLYLVYYLIISKDIIQQTLILYFHC